jgi:exodeoxyribonuclease V gamma subunit
VRDNSEQPPSVLVSQLRDYLSAGWGAEVVAERTTQHPLQPFSRRYFEADSGLFTYAGEWRAAHPLLRASPSSATDGAPEHTQTEVNPADPELPVSLAQLTQFLRNPVKAFFRHRLQVVFEPAQESDSDEECFALDGLQQYGVIEAVLESAEAAGNVPDRTAIASALARVRIAGSLPMRAVGDLQQAALQEVLTTMLGSWHAELSRCPYPAARLSVRVQEGTLVLEDWIGNLRRQQASDQADSDAAPPAPPVWLHLQANKLFAKPDVPKIREEKLLGLWIHCLAIAAAGSPLRGLVVAPDGVLEISGMAQNAARDTMRMLLRLWQEGMRQALPLPPATALAHLAGRNAAQQYEGGFMQRGEVGEPCLARMFPDFETLTADGRFERLAQEVYTPLRDWAQKHVGARLHNAVAVPQLATP